ncbi:hypothetical protein [Clostridium sp. UBA4395]|uniref:hypothetical protein n=1 Tax=Clostridium sp. UBA4395 TaxID=1946360 RepID=UPI003216F234
MKRYIKVFRKDIATTLIKENYILLRTEPNRNNINISVFLFEESEELKSRLDELIHSN